MSEEAKLSRQVGQKASVISKFSPLEADKGKDNDAIIANYGVKIDDDKIDYAATLDKLVEHINMNNIKEKRDRKSNKQKDTKEAPKEDTTPKLKSDSFNEDGFALIGGELAISHEVVGCLLDILTSILTNEQGEERVTKAIAQIEKAKRDYQQTEDEQDLIIEIDEASKRLEELKKQLAKLSKPQEQEKAEA